MKNCQKGVVGQLVEISQPAIVKGSDGFIKAKLVYKDSCDVYKIDTFSGATGFLANDDGTVYDFPGVLESADLAELSFDLPASGTTGLKAGDECSLEFAIQDASGLLFIQFDGKLKINDRLF